MAGELSNDHLAWSAQADLLRRLGQTDESRASYERAMSLTLQGRQRQFLERQLRELEP